VTKFIDDIDYQNYMLAGESIEEEKMLLKGTALDYYARINAIIRAAKEREKQTEQ
jgi:hypothetical protein